MTRDEASDILVEIATEWEDRIERMRRHAEAFRVAADTCASSAQRNQCLLLADACDRSAARTMRKLTALNLHRTLAKEEVHG